MTPTEQWRAEGGVRGRRKGSVEWLLRRDASDAELTHWVGRILVADSVDALFRG